MSCPMGFHGGDSTPWPVNPKVRIIVHVYLQYHSARSNVLDFAENRTHHNTTMHFKLSSFWIVCKAILSTVEYFLLQSSIPCVYCRQSKWDVGIIAVVKHESQGIFESLLLACNVWMGVLSMLAYICTLYRIVHNRCICGHVHNNLYSSQHNIYGYGPCWNDWTDGLYSGHGQLCKAL